METPHVPPQDLSSTEGLASSGPPVPPPGGSEPLSPILTDKTIWDTQYYRDPSGKLLIYNEPYYQQDNSGQYGEQGREFNQECIVISPTTDRST